MHAVWRWSMPLLIAAALAHGDGTSGGATFSEAEWPVYGGDAAQRRYSQLTQITPENVSKLQVVWTYRSGEARGAFSQMQCNPLVIGGTLYAVTSGSNVVALGATNGEERWRFDAMRASGAGAASVSRGVTYWRDGRDQRIFAAAGPYMYALDAATGEPVKSFGQQGRIDLREGLGRDPLKLSVAATTPGTIFRDLIVVGSRVGEGVGAAPGHIRAYDTRTGKRRWIFHTIPQPGEAGHETWPADAWRVAGGANAWAGMSVDEVRGLIFAPTGSASYDFYGGDRHGDNLFANSLLALDALTGKRVWHFQTVHHDMWDRDLPAPPTLATLHRNGKEYSVVAQVTKQGFTFVFDRDTGQPFHPIEERRVAPSDLPGEKASATQPFPLRPPPFARQRYTEDLIPNFSQQSHLSLREKWQSLRQGDLYSPPSLKETTVMPGFDGGAEWGGAAFDPHSGLLYINSSDVPFTLQMLKIQSGMSTAGRDLYLRLCAGCHGARLEGDGANIPSLQNIAARYSVPAAFQLVRDGRGRMPGFPQLEFAETMSLLTYLLDGQSSTTGEGGAQASTPTTGRSYIHTGYKRLVDALTGAPGIKPPWGTLSAIDLQKGELRWQIPLGYYPALAKQFGRNTGAENYGGPIVTAGGLLFIAATPDEMLRAFDKSTGRVLWEANLPAAGFATPATYAINGRQYVVIAAGGGKLGRPAGDTIIAFALPAD